MNGVKAGGLGAGSWTGPSHAAPTGGRPEKIDGRKVPTKRRSDRTKKAKADLPQSDCV